MNNSKQTVLSIVGIAILVIAVVGVSFAFFTYSRNGLENNVITTGTIEFDSNVNSAAALSLENKFPQTEAEGITNSAYSFNVHGKIPATANDVYYGVYLVEGTVPTAGDPPVATKDPNNKFQPSEISAYLTTSGGGANSTVVPAYGARDTNNDGTADAWGGPVTGITAAADTANNKPAAGLKVAYGTITKGGATTETHAYTLTLWVNNTVTISDTDASKTYRAHAYDKDNWPEMPAVNGTGETDPTKLKAGATADTRKVYSNMWYSVKVNVVARDNTSYATAS